MFEILRDIFPDEEVVSPQLDYDSASPFEVRDILAALVTADTRLIVGTSLGGFFALHLWAKHKTVPTILFNAPVTPWNIMPHLEHKDERGFCDELKTIHRDFIADAGDKDKLHAIYGNNDDVLTVTKGGRTSLFGAETFMSANELCIKADGYMDCGDVIFEILYKPINMTRIECGHSASGNVKAIEHIKEIILTLHHNDYSSIAARKDK
jgi:hypothetical protein